MTDQQRYQLKEMAARQSALIDTIRDLQRDIEQLKWMLGNANERVAELERIERTIEVMAEKDADIKRLAETIKEAFIAGWYEGHRDCIAEKPMTGVDADDAWCCYRGRTREPTGNEIKEPTGK